MSLKSNVLLPHISWLHKIKTAAMWAYSEREILKPNSELFDEDASLELMHIHSLLSAQLLAELTQQKLENRNLVETIHADYHATKLRVTDVDV